MTHRQPQHRHLEGTAGGYDRRGLDRMTDAELVAAVVDVVSEPREGPANSFVLHAPLELTARARLLGLTPNDPRLRRLARLRLVSIAARYQTYEPARRRGAGHPDGHPDGHDDLDRSADAIISAIVGGDLDGVDAAVRAAAAAPAVDGEVVRALVDRLAPALIHRTAAAAHGSILLATLVEAPDQAPGWLPLLRPLARELARRPDWLLRWFGHIPSPEPKPGTEPDPDALFGVLADPPRLGTPDSTFIHPTMMQVDAPEVAGDLLGPVAGPGRAVTTGARRALTRVAALAMVRDTTDHAPYGWTHCLTLPQAVLTLAPRLEAVGVPALAIAATLVLGFRASQASVPLDPGDALVRPAHPTTEVDRRRHLVTEAARRHDAHVAKYLLAVLTEADRDPGAAHLYLRAGEHLLEVWDAGGPDPDDLLAAEIA